MPIAEQFGLVDPVPFTPRFNLAPTDEGIVVRLGASGREAATLRWGLVPWWSKDRAGAAKMINARSESVGEKRAFKDAFHRQRCLVPMSGFFEWKKLEKSKQPYFIHAKDGSYLAAAGLFDRWKHEGVALETFTVLTTSSNDAIRSLHDRMPVFVRPESYSEWLDPQTKVVRLLELLTPYPDELIELWPVNPRVGTVANDDPSLIVRYEPNAELVVRPSKRAKPVSKDQLALFEDDLKV